MTSANKMHSLTDVEVKRAQAQRGWTDERVHALKVLWLDGWSASQIAKLLGGTSRNAVIGKVHRVGLAARAIPSRPAKRPRPQPAKPRVPCYAATRASTDAERAAALQKQRAAETTTMQAGETGGVAFADLKRKHCRWPLTTPSDVHRFCGETRDGAGPYCRLHTAAAWQSGTSLKAPRRRRRVTPHSDPVTRSLDGFGFCRVAS